ncbi:hypothetical protein [Phaeospirillum tilakii]|uniref:Uncharacterized protein n=1 Tax=Phaeospirillum tilakii TaxID=741673 RepID=A0ABW5C9W0_9PROT
MGIAYVARSKTLQAWGSDVGLGKNLYKVGYVAEGSPAEALAAGLAGASDWSVVASRAADPADEDELLTRLATREKLVDPAYYPRLRGERGIVKVNPAAIENVMRVRLALETGAEPDVIKVKPTDIARLLLDAACPRAEPD